MDIRGLSYERLAQLVDAGLVHDVADLYALKAGQLVELERFAEKSAEQLVDAIATSKEQPLSRLLFALGIANIGEIAAKQIARHFGTMERIAGATADDVLAVHGIGTILAESLVSWFSDKKARKLVDKLAKHGLTLTEPTTQSGDALKGQTVVITGTLPGLSREQASALVEANGGRVASSVSKKTSFVLVGADAGSKFEKAKELGVRTIEEADFRKLIGE
jgi:DNA ligase (NAD+)